MKKRILILLIFCFIIVTGITYVFILKKEKKIEANDFNLLVITLDTTRADSLGAYGNDQAETPSLDFLAKNGVMFKNCYTPVPLTLPSHATIFTGKYPISHNVRDNGIYILNQREETLAEKMKEMGYHTFSVIASFVLLAKFGLNQGFDFYDDSLNSHKMYNNYNSEITALDVYMKFSQWFDKIYHKKFFGWVHFYDPHSPFRAPKEYKKKFKDEIKGRYNAEVAFMDYYVGKIFEKLREKKVIKKTLVVIVGDHGQAFGEHQEFGHGIFCYEEALKVPLIFYNPRLFPEGLSVKSRVNLIDLLPTILELYGLDIPEGVQGKSFIPMLQKKVETKKRDFYFESMHGKDEMNWAPLMGIINGNYKYISLPNPELYDLDKDSKEEDNLFWKKSRLSRELDKKLKKMVIEYSKPLNATRRNLTKEDQKHLESLGYISSFSGKSNKNMDPKKGIILDNKIKRVFRNIGKKKFDLAERELNALKSKHSEIDISLLYDMWYLLYSKRNETEKAIKTLEEALKKFPKIKRFYILYGHELFNIGKIEEAEKTCWKLLELDPKFTNAYILLGQIFEKRNNINKAINNYRRALDIEPQNISLKLKYAELLILKKDSKLALSIYNELLERNEVSKNTDLLFKVALFNFKYGAMQKSEELLRKAIRLNPKGKYFFNYALVLFKNKNVIEARKNMEIALQKYGSELNDKQINIAKKAISIWQ